MYLYDTYAIPAKGIVKTFIQEYKMYLYDTYAYIFFGNIVA